MHKDIVNNDEDERDWEDLKTFTIDISARNNVQLVQHPPPVTNNQANIPVVRPPNLERAVDFYNSSEDDSYDIIGQEIPMFRTGDRMTTRKFSMNRLKKRGSGRCNSIVENKKRDNIQILLKVGIDW